MNVHILGGSGFLGRRVVQRLVGRGDRVTGTTRSAAAAERLRAAGGEPVLGDLSVAEDIDHAIGDSGADALITSVSLGFGFGPLIVRAAERSGLRRALFVSSTSIFTALDTRTKPIREEAERAIQESSLQWTIVRPTMIYGTPDDGNMVRLLRLVRRSPIVPLPGGGRGLQQPVHVEDLADLIVAALSSSTAIGKSYDIGGPDPLTFRQIVTAAAAATGRRVIAPSVPLRPVIALARFYERVRPNASLRAEQFERLAEDKAFDISAARIDLGYSPRPFEQGIRDEAAMLDR